MRRAFLMSTLALVMLIGVSGESQARYDRRITVYNQTSSDMIHLYISNTGENFWGPDQLGDGVLHAGYHTTLNVDDGSGYCMFDFRAEFRDGMWAERTLNVCEDSSWTVYD